MRNRYRYTLTHSHTQWTSETGAKPKTNRNSPQKKSENALPKWAKNSVFLLLFSQLNDDVSKWVELCVCVSLPRWHCCLLLLYVLSTKNYYSSQCQTVCIEWIDSFVSFRTLHSVCVCMKNVNFVAFMCVHMLDVCIELIKQNIKISRLHWWLHSPSESAADSSSPFSFQHHFSP